MNKKRSHGVERRLLMGGAALGLGRRPLRRKAGMAALPPHPRWKLVFVNHVTTNPFFVPTQYGIQDACAAARLRLPVDRQRDQQRRRDGQRHERGDRRQGGRDRRLAWSIPSPSTGPIARAHAKRASRSFPTMPMCRKSGRLAYIGQDLYASGVRMGERIVSLVPSGRVALFIATPGQLNIQPRIDGAQDAIKKSGKHDQAEMSSPPARPSTRNSRRSTPTTSAIRT